jgi:hypothetical protein
VSVQWDQSYSERFHPEDEDRTEYNPFRGLINGVILSVLIYVPIFIYFWRTARTK